LLFPINIFYYFIHKLIFNLYLQAEKMASTDSSESSGDDAVEDEVYIKFLSQLLVNRI